MFFELKYPGFFLAAALIAAYFAVKLYLGREGLSDRNRSVLFILKYFFISLVILFVFNPEIVRTGSEERPERHLIMFDNSRSMVLNGSADSISVKRSLSGVFDDGSFVNCIFGERTETLSDPAQLNFGGNFTKISGNETNALIEKLISENNIKSLTLFTDGNFSDADNFSLKNNIPVNIIYGSPGSPEPDIFIEDLIYQDDPGDADPKFIIAIGFKGSPYPGSFNIKLLEKGKLIKTISRNIPEPGTFVSVKTDLPPISGNYRDTEFVIEPLKNEKNTFNNKKTAYQRKLVSSDNILLIADTPSFDLTFLVRLLISGGYNFTLVYENSIPDSVRARKFESLILLGSPTASLKPETAGFIKDFPVKMFFIGRKTDLSRLNGLLDAGINNFRYVPAEGKLQSDASGEGGFLMTRSSVPVILNDMPEVEYNSVFFPDETKFRPLMLISGSPKSKAVYHYPKGTGSSLIVNFSSFWKLAFNDDNENFSRLIFNILDLLSADRSLDRIKIYPEKTEYYSGEKVVFRGKILDAKLEPVENAEAGLTVNENSLSAKFTYSNKEYFAEMYIPEPGQYTARINIKDSGAGALQKTVGFKIIENDLETQSIGSDTIFIKNFVNARNGRMLPLSKADVFLNEKRDNKETVKLTSRFNFTRNIFYFIILAAVFLIELAYRKYKDLS